MYKPSRAKWQCSINVSIRLAGSFPFCRYGNIAPRHRGIIFSLELFGELHQIWMRVVSTWVFYMISSNLGSLCYFKTALQCIMRTHYLIVNEKWNKRRSNVKILYLEGVCFFNLNFYFPQNTYIFDEIIWLFVMLKGMQLAAQFCHCSSVNKYLILTVFVYIQDQCSS